MGKDLNGKELGVGLAQRKDGRYTARFVNRFGARKQAYFDTVKKAREWLYNEKYKDEHNLIPAPFDMASKRILNGQNTPVLNDMTVDEWFEFWLANVVSDLRDNTKRNYRERYEFNIRPVLGTLKVTEVKPFHCKKVLIDMEDDYASSTIRQTYVAMGTLFKSALMNGLINKHPMDGVTLQSGPIRRNDIKFLTIPEQEKFLRVARRSHNFDQYQLILETGLRAGELIGLTWDSVNFDKRTITIDKQLEYRHSRGTWEAGPPKTIAGYREIPLTQKAYNILAKLYESRKTRKESPALNTVLEFKDRLTGRIRYLNMKELVFVNQRNGMPSKNSSYNTHLYKLCEEAGIPPISMHALRHTFATRMIERNVNPKALQKILGHGSLSVTMDTYVHVTDESKSEAISLFEKFDGVGEI